MRERVCAYCGEPIKREYVELNVARRFWKSSDVRKVDLHMKCFDKVMGEINREGEEHED